MGRTSFPGAREQTSLRREARAAYLAALRTLDANENDGDSVANIAAWLDRQDKDKTAESTVK